MCEFCNERKQEYDYPVTETDLRLQYEREVRGLGISYEKWLEEKILKEKNDERLVRKGNAEAAKIQEFQKIINDELGSEAFHAE